MEPYDGRPRKSSSTSPWVYVGCGCAAIVILAMAGIAGMSYRRFALFNIVGGIGWVFSMTMIGYSLIKIFPDAERHIHIIIIVVIVLSILPGVIEVLRAYLRKEKEPPLPPPVQ